MAKVKSKYWFKTHKFGIKVPNNTNQAIDFNRENVTTLWCDSVCQYMKNARPAFYPWQKPEGDIPTGYQDIKYRLIFNIKMGEKFSERPALLKLVT